MSNDLIIMLSVLLIPVVISRLIMEKAMEKLEGEMKLKLLDAFSRQRKYRLYFIVPIILVYFLALKYFSEQAVIIVVTVAIIYMAYFLIRSVLNYKKLSFLAVPDSYRKAFLIASITVLVGFTGFGIQLYRILNESDINNSKYEAYDFGMKGVDDMKRADYKNAIVDISKAIELDSTEVTNYLNRGTSYYYSGMMKEAKMDWLKAIAMGNKDAAEWLKKIPG